jgi:hypothetical protein
VNATADQVEQQPGSGSRALHYGSAWEHLADELRLLDARLYLAILRRRERDAVTNPDPFRSMAISEEEIARHINSLAGAWDDGLEPDYGGEQAEIAEAIGKLQEGIWDRRLLSKSFGILLPLPRLSHLFGLDRFEEICLVLCMAAELDRRYERIFAYLQDDLARNRPSIDLFFDILGLPISERVQGRRWFAPSGPLATNRLIRVTPPAGEPAAPFIHRFLQIDERIADHLLGSDSLDPRIGRGARFAEGPAARPSEIRPELEALGAHVARHFSAHGRPQPVAICLYGPDAPRKEAAALAISRAAGKGLIAIDAGQGADAEIGTSALLYREALLSNAAILYSGAHAKMPVESAAPRGTLEIFSSLAPLASTIAAGAQFFSVEIRLPDESERLRVWRTRLATLNGAATALDPVPFAGQFRFTEAQIGQAVDQAMANARQRGPEPVELTAPDVYAACRAQGAPTLGSLAKRISPRYGWSDLVLPAFQADQLREICDQARYSQIVYGEWGFARHSSLGKGVNVLFSGCPGAGKTMSAEIIAGELGLEIYRIDLSQVVSKYVGETEKNLSCVFDEAQGSNAILLFDEADALFGKRSEVKDAHDRYANIEIGFLLQRMEEYSGVSIMSTNLRGNLDDAFIRRLHFIVEFPLPDEAHRLEIWRKHIPPMAPSLDLDLEFLARKFRLSGGSIRNITVSAGFRAAAEKGPLRMKHLILATQREFGKMGRFCAPAEFAEYADLAAGARGEAR